MKRILLLLLLISSIAKAQTDDAAKYTNYRYLYGNKTARLWADSILHAPHDTATLAAQYSIALIGDVLYTKTATKWVVLGGTDQPDGIFSGGVVTHLTGLTFDVSPAVYYIGGVRYTSFGTQITLNAADATDPRIDVIVLSTTGVTKITGDPDPSPAEPQYDPDTQIFLTSVLVAAGATTPSNITSATIYDENTEWTGAASGITVNFNNTSNVFTGSKAADAGTWSPNNYISFTNSTTVSAASYSALKLYIRLKGSVASTANIQLSLLNGSTLVSNSVRLGTSYGFSKTTINTYQTVAVPLSAFTFTGSSFNQLKITFTGTSGFGFYLDNVQLQSGTGITAATPKIDSLRRSNDSVYALKNGAWIFQYKDSTGAATTPTLQQVTDVGSTTTNNITALTLRATPSYLSDWPTALSYSGNGTDAEGHLLLREWSAGDGNIATLNTTALSADQTLSLPDETDTLATRGFVRGLATGSVTETDPVVKAISGIVKSNGTAISAAAAGTDYVAPNAAITGATKTKITYDSKGLVTAGTDATTTDIAEGSNLYYTDARARSAISLTTTGSGAATYDNSTGVLNVPTPAGGSSNTFGKGLSESSGAVSFGQVFTAATDANYTVTSTDYAINLPTVTTNRTITLPSAATNSGRRLLIWNANSGGFVWTFATSPKTPAGTSFTAFPNATFIELVSNGTDWIKVEGATFYGADGTLSGNRTIAGGSFYTQFNSTSSSGALRGSNTSSGPGVTGTNTSTGYAGSFEKTAATTNTVESVLRVQRRSTGTAANNIGGAIDFVNTLSNGSTTISAKIISKLTDVTDATKKGNLEFHTTDGAPVLRMSISATGQINFANVTEYTDNAAALAAGLVAGDVYRTGDNLKIVH